MARGHTPDFPVVLMTAAAAGAVGVLALRDAPGAPAAPNGAVAQRPQRHAPSRRFPGSVIASLVLAWGAAALAHLCLGSPDATPSDEQVAGALRDLGVDSSGLHLAADQTWGSTMYTAGSDSEISVEVVGRDSTDARLLGKLWRFIWYKDSGPTLSLAR